MATFSEPFLGIRWQGRLSRAISMSNSANLVNCSGSGGQSC